LAEGADLNRRQLIGSSLLIAAVMGGAGALWARVQREETGEATDRERAVLRIVSDLVIPRTDTPGAVDVGVPAFVELALNHGLEGSRPPASSAAITQGVPRRDQQGGLFVLARLADRLDAGAPGKFTEAPADKQLHALQALDADFGKDGADPDWTIVKRLILIGYYTSEPGGSVELNYELVPGRWDADLPLSPDRKAYSSDWTAVEFG
jgi:hypothetical protein